MSARRISNLPARTVLFALAALTICQTVPVIAQVRVVTTLPDYAAVAREIGGDLVDAESIAVGNQDPHFVLPKPSFALLLKRADLFVTSGLDLEMWAPTIIDKARNPDIVEGSRGYVACGAGVDMLERPTRGYDRSAGEIHVYGNPHFQTSLLEIKVAADNICFGLCNVDPTNEATYEANLDDFKSRIDRAMYGDQLVEIVDPDRLDAMVRDGTLIEFLEAEITDGEPLINQLGGYLRAAMPFRGLQVIAYHKNWSYFARDFGIEVLELIEAKPGIPPTAKHVKEVIDLIDRLDLKIMLVANYFEKNTPRKIEERAGIRAVILPVSVGGAEGTETVFDLFDLWIEAINHMLEEIR